jgi:tripartite-type tricarboxylate transporter receptor subunit TctC
LALVARGMALEPLFGGQGVRYDPLMLNWIGSTSNEVSVIAVRADTGVKTLEDAQKREVIVAATAPGTDGVTYPSTLNNLLGTKFKMIPGYRSGAEMTIAVERKEVEGRGSWSWASFRNDGMRMLKAGELNLLVQMTTIKSPEIPNVPMVMDYAKTDEQRQVLELLLAGQAMAWPVFAPAEVPKERVAILRRAYLAMLKDPETLADAQRLGIDVDPVPGEAIEAMLKRVYATPPAIVARVRDLAGRN